MLETKKENDFNREFIFFRKGLFRKGFLYKQFGLKQLDTDISVRPGVEEV
jgi:hypothetical protein